MKGINRTLGWALTWAVSCAPVQAAAPRTPEGAMHAVESFCAAEFDGDAIIRADTVMYSRKRAAQERGRDALGRITYITNDVVFIACGYKVLDVSMHGTRATVRVEFCQLASTLGQGEQYRRFVADYQEHEVVAYAAVYRGRKWWIFDPPPPRISREAAIAGYQEYFVNNIPDGFMDNPAVMECQKKLTRKKEQELEFLKTLSPDTPFGSESPLAP